MNEWRCSNGQCIPENQRCDVKHDCEDLSDETDCGKYTLLKIFKETLDDFP